MKKEDAARLTKEERIKMSNMPRKLAKAAGHTHGGHSRANAGFTCDDTKDPRIGKTGVESRSAALGPYRVQMPPNRTRYVRPPVSA